MPKPMDWSPYAGGFGKLRFYASDLDRYLGAFPAKADLLLVVRALEDAALQLLKDLGFDGKPSAVQQRNALIGISEAATRLLKKVGFGANELYDLSRAQRSRDFGRQFNSLEHSKALPLRFRLSSIFGDESLKLSKAVPRAIEAVNLLRELSVWQAAELTSPGRGPSRAQAMNNHIMRLCAIGSLGFGLKPTVSNYTRAKPEDESATDHLRGGPMVRFCVAANKLLLARASGDEPDEWDEGVRLHHRTNPVTGTPQFKAALLKASSETRVGNLINKLKQAGKLKPQGLAAVWGSMAR